ncbi:hypothetical protein [Thermomonas carbonis]|uniref:hypothetical protein n=1 Tax=Thermomonas carbonis TaxID=1463158 RepID=UPI003CCCD3D8
MIIVRTVLFRTSAKSFRIFQAAIASPVTSSPAAPTTAAPKRNEVKGMLTVSTHCAMASSSKPWSNAVTQRPRRILCVEWLTDWRLVVSRRSKQSR